MKTFARSRLIRTMFAAVALLTLWSVEAAPEGMTQEKAKEYFRRFNNEDVSYAEFYTDDVTFPHVSGSTLRGPQQIVDYYKKFWASGAREIREPTVIIIDHDAGWMAVELKAHLTAKPGTAPTLPGGVVMKEGEEWEGGTVLIYGLRNGKISSIRGGLSGMPKRVKP